MFQWPHPPTRVFKRPPEPTSRVYAAVSDSTRRGRPHTARLNPSLSCLACLPPAYRVGRVPAQDARRLYPAPASPHPVSKK